jgi:transforming growth factor-beta-induced protein
MQQVLAIVVLAFVACALTGCGGGSTTTSPPSPATTAPAPVTTAPAPVTKNIVQLAQATPDLSTLVKAVVAATYVDSILSSVGPFTVFAPNNSAFAKLPAGALATLLKPENKEELTDVLLYHVVSGTVLASDLKNESIKTVEGASLKVTILGANVMINDATVITPNVIASNGVVHIIDTVLMSPNIVQVAQATPDLSTLVTAVVAANLTATLSSVGPVTVFAPNNSAFAKLPAGALATLLKPENKKQLTDVLLYHVVSGTVLASDLKNESIKTVEGANVKVTITGTKVMINNATVITPNVIASNGVVHIIDTVLMPPFPATKNIVQLAQATPELSTLVTAVVAANLTGTLSSVGPFTVFAPTNSAFAKLPAGALATLLKPENKKQLTDVLLYHVVSGTVLASDLKNESIKTVEGANLKVTITGTKVTINNATVITPNVIASNGVVHIIDTVLMPPAPAAKNIVQLAQATPALSTLVEAVVAANLTGTLSSVGPFTVFAPNNGAFAKLPAGVLATLLKPENMKQLTDLLLYHVVSGTVLASDLKNESIKTVEGADLKVTIIGGKVMINEATVTTPNVIASNGVVHIIDGVLSIPKALAVYLVA